MPAPYYETEIAQLEAQLAAPESEVQSGAGAGYDRVIYSSKSEILAALTYFKNLAAAARTPAKSPTTLAAFERD